MKEQYNNHQFSLSFLIRIKSIHSITQLFGWIIIILCPVLLFAEVPGNNSSSSVNISHPMTDGVTIAYRLDSAPMQFKNERGHADGILIDLWRLWSIKSGIPVHFVGTYNKEAQQMVADGRADINAGLFKSKKREKFLDFSDPILDSGYFLFYQPSLDNKNNIETFEDLAIGVTQGSFHETYLKEHYPQLKLALFDGYKSLFLAAINGEIPAFVTQPHYLKHYLKSQQQTVLFKRLEPALYTRDYKASVRKGNHALLSFVNQYLSLITLEDRRVVLQHWLGKLSQKSANDKTIDLTEDEKQWLLKHPVIEIGVDGNWPPIDFMVDEKEHRGIVNDFLNHIAQQLNVQFKVIPGPTFKEMLAKVSSGDLKVAASVVKTEEREKKLWFTKPFFTVQKVIISKKDARTYQNAQDLSGKLVAIENGFSTMKQLQKLYPEIKLKVVESTLEALKEVSWGNADAYIGNGAVAQWIMQEHQITNLEFTGDPKLGPAPQRFAINQDEQWKPLLGIFNKALSQIDNKQRTKIYQQWIGIPGLIQDLSRRMNLTDVEREWLEKHNKIRLGVDPSWPPIEFIDKNGNYQGLSAEFIKVIANSLNLTMLPVDGLNWSEVMEKAESQQIDVIPSLVQSKERDKFLNFTQSYLSFPFVIFVRDDKSYTTGITDLHGKKVAVEKAYVTEEYLARDHPEINLILVDNTLEGLEKVSVGMVDAYVGNLTVGSYLLTTQGITNVKVGGTTPYSFDLKIGIRKDWPELIGILNKFFNALSNEEKSHIRQKWLSVKYDIKVDDTIVRRIIAIASILLIISIIWIIFSKRKQNRLRRSEEQLKRIIDTIPLAIVLSDQQGTIIRANPHVTKEIQSGTNSIVGRNLVEFYDDNKEREQVLKTLKEEGKVQNMRVHFRTNTGGIVTGLLSAIPIRMGDQILNLGVFVNLTARMKMEDELKKARDASEQANQFKSNFLANMSHEIRTPMNAIVGMTHLALQTELTDKQFDYIHKAKISAHNLLGIINDILDFSKVEAGKLNIEETEFSLDEVLDNLSGMVNLKAEEKGLEILFNREITVPDALIGDPLRLGQVLINLVQNAIKFTENGEVVISVVLIHANNNVRIKFSVCDSGIGIEPEQIQQLFDPFVQADSSISRKHGGTGLGLSISKQIVELMGGHLNVKSEPGKGSTFSFSLDFEKQQGVGNKFYNYIPEFSQLKVLLVDDNPIAQKILQEMLNSFSLQVSVASSAKEAYDILQKEGGSDIEEPEAFDLVLLDWRMPEVNGIDAAHYIKSNISLVKNPKIILITAYGREEVMQQAENAPLDGFLIKPVSPSTLWDTLISIFKSDEMLRYRKQTYTLSHRLKGKVLLVEDNSINQQVAKELLEGYGLLVTIANNGREALESINKTDFNLILMDVQMPIMDGLEATRLIRAENKFEQLPIVAMTAHAMEADKEICLEAGMSDYLSKPIDPDKLLMKLSQWLDNVLINEHADSNDYSGSTVFLPGTLPGIDLAWGLKRVGGNKELFVKLLKDFVNNHNDSCEKLLQFIKNKDIESAQRLVHIIHGVAGNIGAHDLQESAWVIEKSIRENLEDYEQYSFQAREFCHNANIIFDNLNTLIIQWEEDSVSTNLSHSNESNVEVKDTQRVEEYPILLERLAKLLENGDSGARSTMEVLKNMLNLLDNEVDTKLINQLEQQIYDYEYDEALETIELLIRAR